MIELQYGDWIQLTDRENIEVNKTNILFNNS